MSELRRLSHVLLAGATAATSPALAQQPLQTPAPPSIAEAPQLAPPAAIQAQPQPARGAPLSIAPPETAEAAAPAPQASLEIGQRADFTRLSFRFPAAATVTPHLAGDRLELRFSRAADIDLAVARANLPRFVRGLSRVSAPGQPLRLALTLDPGVRQRHFVDGARVVVDLLAPPEASAAATANVRGAEIAETGQAPQGPAAPSGTASVRLIEEADATRIVVRWATPARAAAFRRGEAIYLLFEANGSVDLRGVGRAGRRHRDLELVQGEGVVGMRIPAQPDILVSARADGASWSFVLGRHADNEDDAPVRIDAEHGGRIVADFGRGGVVRAIEDPEIGDRLLVALLPGPAKGVEMRRATLEAAILPSAQGAVIEPRADGVGAAFEGGALVVSREAGLIHAAGRPAPAAHAASEAVASALIEAGPDGAATALSNRDIRERLDLLTRRAAAEGVAEGAPNEARLALARFLLDNELAAEALGALRLAAINQPEVELDPEFRLMRGAANVMMRRARDAEADLSASALQDDPSAALWRGYAAAEQQNWTLARRELARGAGALEQHPPSWRARFALALAEAALEVNDIDSAETAARAAVGQAQNRAVRLHARLVEARILSARGRTAEALALFEELSRARDEEVAVRAQLEAIRLRRRSNELPLADAADRLEALRYRWRGDDLEIATVGTLGAIYAEMSRWREALATMRVAAERFPSELASRQLQSDMQAIFTRLFLEGEADDLEPIQALGLFYEFSDLTPIGPDGDRIVRSLSGRLVAVDLLEQAEVLLQHQVDERLEGLGKAQVASELAAIYLMDRKPDRALVAINASRQPNMPAALAAERRILEARAHLDLGRLDHAVELVERDQSAEGQRVRAEAAWRARDWERAAAEMRALLRARNRATPLDADARQIVLRSAVALTLAQNDEAVRALYREYAGDMAGTPDADAFEIVASGIQAEGRGLREVARAVARTDLLDRFLGQMRARMTAHAPQPANAPAAPAAPAQPAIPAPAQAAAPPRPSAQAEAAPSA